MDDASSQALPSASTTINGSPPGDVAAPSAAVPDTFVARWGRHLRTRAHLKWIEVSPSIPGTRARRYRRRREILARARPNLKVFDTLRSLSPESRRGLRRTVRKSLNRMAVVDVTADAFE